MDFDSAAASLTASRLPNDDDLLAALNTLALAMTAPQKGLQLASSAGITLDHLLNILMTAQTHSTLEMSCKCIESVAEAMGRSLNLFESYENAILLGLGHPSVRVKLLVLKLLKKHIDENEGALTVPSQVCSLLVSNLEFKEDIHVPEMTVAILIKMAKKSSSLEFLLNDTSVSSLFELLDQSDDVVKFRAYELLVGLSAISKSAFEAVHRTGLLEPLNCEITSSNDIMATLNALEILRKIIAMTPNPLDYLTGSSLLAHLLQKLTPPETIDTQLETAAILTLFTTLIQSHSSTIPALTATDLLPRLDTLLDPTRPYSVTIQTLTTLSALATHPHIPIHSILSLRTSTQGDVALAATHTLAACIRGKTHVLTVLSGLGDIIWISRDARSPFDGMRRAALDVCDALVGVEQGVQAVLACGVLVDYLVERKMDDSRELKECKFAIANAIVSSNYITHQMEDPVVQRFKKYVRDGAYLNQVQPQVAVQSQ